MRRFEIIKLGALVVLALTLRSGEAGSQSYGACADHMQCAPQNICLMGQCVFAYGRDYAITVHSASGIPTRAPGGRTWDPMGGLPDPIVALSIDGRRYQTPYVPDTLTPVWNYTISPVRVNQSTRWDWLLADWDEMTRSEPIMRAAGPQNIPVMRIRQGRWTASTGGMTIVFGIRPL